MLHRLVARLTLALSLVCFVTLAHANQPLERLVLEHTLVQQGLKEVAAGIDSQFRRDPVAAAEQLYALARHATEVIVALGNNVSPEAQGVRRTLLDESTATLRRIVQLQEYVQNSAVQTVRLVEPGEPLQELWSRGGHDLVRPLFRTEIPRPGQPKPDTRQRTQELTREFVAKGGNLSLFQPLTKKFLETVPSGQLFTWVEVGAEVRVYPGDIKHVVLAQGKSVHGAGNGKVIRSKQGEVLLVLWSNSSGNYKPGLGTLEGPIAQTIALGVPSSRIIGTSSYPMDPGIIKLLGRVSRGLGKEQIGPFLADVQARTAPQLFTGLALAKIPEVQPIAAWRAHFEPKPIHPPASRRIAIRAARIRANRAKR